MVEVTRPAIPTSCGNSFQLTASIEALNGTCYCLSLNEAALRFRLEVDLDTRGLSQVMVESHRDLFASIPMFVSHAHFAEMAQVIRVVEEVVQKPQFRRAVLAWAPEIASFDPLSRGGLLGYDFHLTAAGPQLIEINTNPGGALLNLVLGGAQHGCCADAAGLVMAPMAAAAFESALFEIFSAEWKCQRNDAPLRSIAIVDETPDQQYLYPEFLLYRHFFAHHGIDVTICDPRELDRRDGRLWHRGRPLDFVYNRLTDFALQEPAHVALRLAYLAREVVVSPHPRAHALYADKRNLTLLCDEKFLRGAGVTDESVSTLVARIPHTELVTPENIDRLWAKRRALFFKPAAGYGSKATYRGDKLTKRVWGEIAKGAYVAQARVDPSERRVANAQTAGPLKVDIRNYAYDGIVKLVAARLYQGQTTNFRTPGGGFAPVFTEQL